MRGAYVRVVDVIDVVGNAAVMWGNAVMMRGAARGVRPRQVLGPLVPQLVTHEVGGGQEPRPERQAR